MLQPEVVLETVEIVKGAIEKGMLANLMINNRAGGNAPMIVREIGQTLIKEEGPQVPYQMNLWDT
ncbi:MAG: hypothetical protein ABSA04_05665 [Desulfobaccales bacterium]|jgi:hypothetical protein